jgi:hypothetical protein
MSFLQSFRFVMGIAFVLLHGGDALANFCNLLPSLTRASYHPIPGRASNGTITGWRAVLGVCTTTTGSAAWGSGQVEGSA